jgi:pilus assembly protein CpaC
MQTIPRIRRYVRLTLGCGLLTCATMALPVAAQPQAGVPVTKGNLVATAPAPAAARSGEASVVGPAMELSIGKSSLMRVSSPIERISVGNPNIADITLINSTQLYLIGKNYGSTNLLIWRRDGTTMVVDVNVNIDADRMEKKLREFMPEEQGIRVRPAADAVILTGTVSSAVKAKHAEDIANAFVRDINRNLVLPVMAGDTRVAAGSSVSTSSQSLAGTGQTTGTKVVNLLQVTQGQQVMLEVKVAEVSKTLLERLGVNVTASATTDGITYGLLSSLFTGNGVINITGTNGNKLSIDANKSDTLVKVLAEPNIIAISGQEASFLAGGKIFIPIVTNTGLGSSVTLQEREYGVGVKFTPTVLDGTRINLKVAPEVSDIGKGTSFKVNSSETVVPNFTTNRVQTTVQLNDGQSLAIAGLIKNNINEVISRVPVLGEIPILGALFRSSEFQNNRTELVFLITPRLVKPLDSRPVLPTDNFVPPSRGEFFLGGKQEGSRDTQEQGEAAKAEPATRSPAGGFQMN